MAYYDYDEGNYQSRTLSEDDMWGAFSFALSNKSMHAASYKFGFLKAILDNLYNVDSELRLSFDQLFSKFTEIYWNLILKYHLRQNPGERTTYLEQVLLNAKQKYQLQEEIPYESLTTSMMLDVNHQVKIKCKNNVVGALFGDTQELFYSFSKKGEWIQINPQMYTFVCRHKLIIEKLNYYEWAKYLEKVNTVSQSPYLLLKLDESTLRSNLSYYRNILHDEFECNTCFYCGKKLTDGNTHVDHFIPWSFVKSDNIWNFVLACNTCNTKKNNNLANEEFLNKIIIRNKEHLNVVGYENYTSDRLVSLYKWAYNNGYTRIWSPS